MLSAAPATSNFTFFDQTFTRQTGQPVTTTVGVVPPAPGTFTMQVTTSNVTSAVVTLNGTTILQPSDFSRNRGRAFERTETLLATNVLTVEVRGAPGSWLRINFGGEDDDPPVIRAVVTPTPNAGGWNASDVVVTFECLDTGSGVATCPPPVQVTSEGKDQVVTGTAIDRVGQASIARVVINVDKTMPLITGRAVPPANAEGWHRTDLTAVFACDDLLSGIESCAQPVDLAALGNEGSHELTGAAVDRAGLTASAVVGVKLDSTAPQIAATADRAPDDDGWYLGPVTVSFTCSDERSGVATCPDPLRIVSAGDPVVATGTALDRAGNSAVASLALRIRSPLAPGLAATQTPPPNAAGWNNTDVVVTFTCQDNGSGVQACPPPQTATAEGRYDITASVSDLFGTTRTITVPIQIDRTAPSITAAVEPPAGPGGWHTAVATTAFTCSDALSGMATCPAPVVIAGEGAAQVAIGAATDQAGNTATASASINVDMTPPTVTATVSDSADVASNDVVVTFECLDAGSGVADCPAAVTVNTEGLNQAVSGTAHDVAGNAATSTVTVSVDRTRPTIVAAVTPAANGAGWHNTPVTVTFTCADAGSAIVSCPDPVTVATNGSGQLVSGEARDAAGNRTAASVTLNIDTVAPVISQSVAPPADGAGWHHSPVTVTFICSDGLSAIDSCTPPIVVANEVEGEVVVGVAVDRAGNTASTAVTINVDLSVTTIRAVAAPASNAAGWNNTPVIVTFVCEDALGPVAGCPAPIEVATEGAGQNVQGSVTDRAGQTVSVSLALNLDFTPPGIVAAVQPPANPLGWHAQPATVTFTCGDALSEVTVCTQPVTVPGGVGQAVNGTAIDRAGNIASATVIINIDAAAPVVVATVAPPPNAAGWNNTDVTVSFACTDNGAGLVECPAPFTVTTEGADQTFPQTVFDRAGNSVLVTTQLSIDRTPPVVAIIAPLENAVLSSSPIRVLAQLTDALSGIAAITCDSHQLPGAPTLDCERALAPGQNTIVVRATDAAGNETVMSRTVQYELNRAPRALPGGPYTGVTGSPIAFNGVASFDPDAHPLTYAWRFGDGTTGSGTQPSHTYPNPGTFTVALTVDDGNGGTNEATTTVTVAKANTVPTVRIGGPYVTDVGASLLLDAAASTDADGDALTATWNFGDGATGSGLTPRYTYRETGVFTAAVTIADGHGGSATGTTQVTVRTTNRLPIAQIGGPYRGELNRAIAFDASASTDPDNDALTFAWSFGDGGAAADVTPSHTFATTGVFPVTVIVTDARGGASSSSTLVTVATANAVPTANANGPYTQETGFPLTLSSAGSIDPDGDVLTFTWRFGDGRSSTGPSPAPSYTVAGTYTVELTVDDGKGGAATDSASVTIVPRANSENRNPVAAAGGPYTVEIGVPIAMNPLGSVDPDGDGLSYAWTFGDGGTSSERAPVYAWAAAGTYPITLTVSDGRGGSGSASAESHVTAPPDRAPPRITVLGPTEVLPGAQFTAVAQVADSSAIASVTFDMVDGTTTRDEEPPFERAVEVPAVAAPGVRLVLRATATDAAGNTGSGELAMTIVVQPDDESPTVTLHRPPQAAPGSSARLSADVADNAGVKEVAFLVNDVAVGIDRASPFEMTFAVPETAVVGSILRVAARASDYAGNESQATGDITIVALTDDIPPTMTLSAPAIANPGSTFRISAAPSDNSGISSVQLRIDGVPAGDFTAPPFEVDVPVAAGAAIGSLLRIEGTAIDFSGLAVTASANVRVTSPFSAGEGLVLGEVYDDAMGVPLAGARVQLSGQTESGAPFVAETGSDARGAYVLRVPAGAGRITVSRDGWTAATRSIGIVTGQVQVAIDARLSQYDTSQQISPVLGATIAAGDLQVRIGAGDVAGPVTVRARRLSPQGLHAPLPLGWTPLAAIDLFPPDVPFAIGAELVAPVPAGISTGRMLHLVVWDAEVAAWRVIASMPAPESRTLSTPLTATGQFVWIVGDVLPVSPPISGNGELLQGAQVSALPADATAAVTPQPRVLIYEPGARSDVRTDVPSVQPLSSGTRLQATIQETYQFVDQTTLRLDPFVQDLFFHQLPGDATRLRAAYPVSSSLQLEPLSFREGVIAVDVRDAALSDGLAIAVGGGVIDGDNGVRFEIPPGAVQQLAAASLQPLSVEAFGLPLPDDVIFVGGATVSLSMALDASGLLSVPLPAGLDPASSILLVRASDVAGVSRLVLTALGRIDGDRVTTVLQLPRNGVALPGIRGAGRYAFVAMTSGTAFAFGRVLGVSDIAFADALVTSDTLPIASRSAADGSYVSALRAAVSMITARDVVRSDSGFAPVTPDGNGDELALDLRLRAEPPHVTAITPNDGAVNVPPTSPVTVRFSEPINPASVSATALTVEGAGGFVAGAVALSEGDTVLTFRPAEELTDDTVYTVRVADVQDRSGVALTAPFTTHFSSVDTTAPLPPQAGLISASIPDSGFSTVAGSQGSAGAHDTVTIVNLTRGTTSPVLLDPNGGFNVRVGATVGDRLQIVITDRGGNSTVVAAPPFRQTNPDGSISTAVTVEGGVVEGPGGVAVEVPRGAFPVATVITLKPVSEAQFPFALSAEQRQVFRYSGGIDIDLGGRVPTTYLNVSIPTVGGETLDDQWIVGQVTYVDGQVVLDAADTARVINGRIHTSSPPCPGVTGSGVYGFLRSARPLGVTYAGIPNPDPQLSSQLLVAAIVPMALVPGTLRMPIFMPAVAGGAIAMAEAVHAEFLNQSRRMCLPLLSGKVTIAPSTVRLRLLQAELTDGIEEVVVTNLNTGKKKSFFKPFDTIVTMEGGSSDAFQAESIDYLATRAPLTSTVEPRAYVRVDVDGGVLAIGDTQIQITNVTRNRTWASGISSSASRPLGNVATFLEGEPGDTYRVDVTDGATDAVRQVAFGVAPYAVGSGNLLVRAALGSIDPTQAQMDAYNAGKPASQHVVGEPVEKVELVRPNGARETILDVATGDTARVTSGAFLYAFSGLATDRYSVDMHYRGGRVEGVDIPTFQITVRRGVAGTPIREIVGQVPPRGEPLQIDLGLGGAPPTLFTDPDGFFHVESHVPITLSFSQALDRQSVTDHLTLKVVGASGIPTEVHGSWQFSNGDRTVTFVPTWPLQMGKTYHAVMNGVTAGGQPLSVTTVPIKTFAPVKLSTFSLPSSITPLASIPFGDLEILKSQVASNQVSLVASTTSSEGPKLHTIDVSDPRTPVKVGQTSGGLPRRLRVVQGVQRPLIDVQYDVPLLGQQTGMSCWAASAAMVVAFRDQVSVDPLEIAMAGNPTPASQVGGYWEKYADGIDFSTATTDKLFSVWGLTSEPAQSLTIDGLRDMLLQYGPLWTGVANGVGAHVRVITGIVGDGTPEGTAVLINDPWDIGKEEFELPNSGSQYPELFTEFVAKQEVLARRLYGDANAANDACNQGNLVACRIILTPSYRTLLRACNLGDQSACDKFPLPGTNTMIVAHLSTRPSHAVPTGPADPGLPLLGGATNFSGVPPVADRLAALAPCTAHVSIGPSGEPVFAGDLLAAPYYSSIGSGINFFDVTDPANPCILGGRPLSRNPETAPPPGGADQSARGTVKQYGLARGVTIVPTTVGLEAFVSLAELGLMPVNISADIPSVAPAARTLGPVYPGDFVDVAAHGEYLLALNNNNGALASLDVVAAGLSPVASVSFEATRSGVSKVHQLVVARNVMVRRGLPSGQMGTVRMSLVFVAGANGITIIDITDVETPTVIGVVPMPGIVRTLALSKDAKMLLAGGDAGPTAGGGTRLFVIDVSNPLTAYLVDSDGDQFDDRILFSAPYLASMSGEIAGLDYDDTRGLAYVASSSQIDIWAIRRSAAVTFNGAPIAQAGPAVTVDPDITVTLDGSASRDPDGDPITHHWSQIAGPPVTLDVTDPVHPTFSTQGLSNVAVAFQLVVRDATAISIPDTVTITVRRQAQLTLTPAIALVPIVPGTKPLTATLVDAAGAGTNVSADTNTRYEWIGNGLVPGIDGVPDVTSILSQLTVKFGSPVHLADISVNAAGLLNVLTPGLQVVRATHHAGGRDMWSEPSIVLAGIELDEISLKPESAISTLAGVVADAIGSDSNPPLVLGNAASGWALNTGVIVLHDVTFKFGGTGSLGLRDLLDAIRPVIAVPLNALVPGGGTAITSVLLGAFSTLAGIAGTQLLETVESTEPGVATVTSETGYKGVVQSVAPGPSAITGTLNLGALGSADDSVLVWVLPSIDSVRVEPNLTAMRETDPPTPGPNVRMYAESTVIATAAVPLSGKAQTVAELLDRFLPDGLASWSAGFDKAFVVDTPVPGLKIRVRGQATPNCSGPDATGKMSCSIALANLGLGFPVPNVFSPLITTGYSLGNTTVAQMGTPALFDTPVIHQGVAGLSTLTGTVSVVGLGSATDSTARVVVGRGPVIVKQPVVAANAAPPGSVMDFVITVTNPFADPMPGITVVDTFYYRPPGGAAETVLNTQTFTVGTLQPGASRTIRTSIAMPAGQGAVRNEAASAGSVSSSVIITIDPTAAPARRPLINEIVFEPQRDWDDSGGGGDGVPFNDVPGTNVAPHASLTAADHWIELLTNTGSPAEVTGWTLTFVNASMAPVTMTLSPATVISRAGSPYVIVPMPAGMSPSAAVTLSDTTGGLVDTVALPAVFAALGPATGIANEAIARTPDGAPGGATANFTRKPSSIGGRNP